jgi:c(7)-type cytochrome triheme protein
MKRSLALIAAIVLALSTGLALSADAKKAPETIVFEAKPGAVTFPHAKHVEAAKNDCTVCHDSLFKQERGDLGYKAGMHKKAEAEKSSCAACHVAGGKSFESKGNCNKCHEKK